MGLMLMNRENDEMYNFFLERGSLWDSIIDNMLPLIWNLNMIVSHIWPPDVHSRRDH